MPKPEPVRIVVIVSGGLVQSVHADAPALVQICDYDELEHEDKIDPPGWRDADLGDPIAESTHYAQEVANHNAKG